MNKTIMDNLNFQLREAEINKHLQLTLQLYLLLKKKSQNELATEILRTGSKLAQFLMDFYGIKPYKVSCPSCRTQVKDKENIEAINNIGECLSCDHLRTDPNDQLTGTVMSPEENFIAQGEMEASL
jgi:hypothetical protein